LSLADQITSDLDIFLNTDDFAVEAILPTGISIHVIFHNEYDQVSLMGMGLESRDPYFEAKESDVSDLSQGETITIDEVEYKIIRFEPDGTGISKVYLSKD
jgi:hypothetical protein